MGLLPSKNNRRENNKSGISNGQPGNNTPGNNKSGISNRQPENNNKENSNQGNNKSGISNGQPENNNQENSNQGNNSLETLTLHKVLDPRFKENREKTLVDIPNLEMNINTLTDDQISKYLLKHYSKIDFNDNVIDKNTRTTFINSTLKIFLDIIWEYLIYHTIDTENKLKTICDEKILHSDVQQTSKEYISSKIIHTCFNIKQEIVKINKNFEEDCRYLYKNLKKNHQDLMKEYTNYQDYRDDYKKKEDPFHKNISINGIEIEHNNYNFYLNFSNENENENEKISLGVRDHFHYSFSISQEYIQEFKQSIEDYSKVQRSNPKEYRSKLLFPYYNIDNDKFNVFQFLYEEEYNDSLKGIIPSLNLSFQQQLPNNSIIKVNDIIGSFNFEGNITGGFRNIINFDFFYIIFFLLQGIITWENGKKCFIGSESDGTDISLNGYLQFNDCNFNGLIKNNIIRSKPYFDRYTSDMVYSTIFRKNDDKSFRLKDDFPINTKNRNFELNIPNHLLLVYNPEQVTETKKKQVRAPTPSKKSKKKKRNSKTIKGTDILKDKEPPNKTKINEGIKTMKIVDRDFIKNQEKKMILYNENHVINIENIKDYLQDFIDHCLYPMFDQQTNIIINNRRRLIFPILEELLNKNFFKDLIRLSYDKNNIYIYDIANIEKTGTYQKDTKNPRDNRLTSSSSTSSSSILHSQDNRLNIEIYHTDKPKNQEFINISIIEETTIKIGISCITNFNDVQQMNEIIQYLSQIKQYKNCYRSEKTTRKNPLDDFLILIIVQFLYEFRTLLNFSNIKQNYKFDVEIVSKDKFRDWNVEYQVSNYKENNKKFEPIFDFTIINPKFKKSVEHGIDRIYQKTQEWMENDTNILIQNFMSLNHEG